MGSRTRTPKERSLLADEATGISSVFTEVGPTVAARPPIAASSSSAPASFELPRASSQSTGTLFGRYRLLKRLASGGMGEIHLARQEGVGGFEKLCVIKRLLPHLRSDRDQVKMFFDEARLQALMSDRHIVQIFDMGEVEGQYFIAMEYVHGTSWRRLIDRLKEAGRSIHPGHAVALAVQVAHGLSYAHNIIDAAGRPLDIVHRDVNPHNLLASYDGECKLIDFGIAKSQMSLVNTEAGTIKGKFAYMSPEQAGAEKLDRRSDIFSFGICLYELLTGQNPFHRANLVLCLDAIVNQQPPPLDEARPELAPLAPLVERCLAKRREERFGDCAELAAALTQLYNDGFCGDPEEPLGAWLKQLFAPEIEEHLRLLAETGTSGMARRAPGAASGPAPLSMDLTGTSSPSLRSRRDPTLEGPSGATSAEPATELAPPPSTADVEAASSSSPPSEAASPPVETVALPEGAPPARARLPLVVGALLGVALGATAIGVLAHLEEPAPAPAAPLAAPALVLGTGEEAPDDVAVVPTAPLEGSEAAPPPAEGAPEGGSAQDVEEAAAGEPVVDVGSASPGPSEATEAADREEREPRRRRRAKRRSSPKATAASTRGAERVPAKAPEKARAVVGQLSVNAGGPFSIRSGRVRRTNTAALPLYEGEVRGIRIGGDGAPFQVTLTVKPVAGGVSVKVDSAPWSVVRVDNIGRGRTPVAGLSLDGGGRARIDLKSPEAKEPMQITLRFVPEGG